jgi:hypothetical protein
MTEKEIEKMNAAAGVTSRHRMDPAVLTSNGHSRRSYRHSRTALYGVALSLVMTLTMAFVPDEELDPVVGTHAMCPSVVFNEVHTILSIQ